MERGTTPLQAGFYGGTMYSTHRTTACSLHVPQQHLTRDRGVPHTGDRYTGGAASSSPSCSALSSPRDMPSSPRQSVQSSQTSPRKELPAHLQVWNVQPPKHFNAPVSPRGVPPSPSGAQSPAHASSSSPRRLTPEKAAISRRTLPSQQQAARELVQPSENVPRMASKDTQEKTGITRRTLASQQQAACEPVQSSHNLPSVTSDDTRRPAPEKAGIIRRTLASHQQAAQEPPREEAQLSYRTLSSQQGQERPAQGSQTNDRVFLHLGQAASAASVEDIRILTLLGQCNDPGQAEVRIGKLLEALSTVASQDVMIRRLLEAAAREQR